MGRETVFNNNNSSNHSYNNNNKNSELCFFFQYDQWYAHNHDWCEQKPRVAELRIMCCKYHVHSSLFNFKLLIKLHYSAISQSYSASIAEDEHPVSAIGSFPASIYCHSITSIQRAALVLSLDIHPEVPLSIMTHFSHPCTHKVTIIVTQTCQQHGPDFEN